MGFGILFILIGVVHILKPKIWDKMLEAYPLSETMSPQRFKIFMIIVGVVSLGLGVYMFIEDLIHRGQTGI